MDYVSFDLLTLNWN